MQTRFQFRQWCQEEDKAVEFPFYMLLTEHPSLANVALVVCLYNSTRFCLL